MKAVLLDLDGLLIDSRAHHLNAIIAAIETNGVAPPAFARVALIDGEGGDLPKIIGKLLPKECRQDMELIDAIIDDFRAESSSSADSLHPVPGARKAISALRGEGVKTALVTNRGRNLHELLVKFNLASKFDAVICPAQAGERVAHRFKPHHGPLYDALGALDCQPGHALFVGDTEADALAGRSGRIRTVIVPNRFDVAPFKHLAWRVVSDISDVPHLVHELNNGTVRKKVHA